MIDVLNINLIVAIDENWAIGYQNHLLIKISDDLKHFKSKTINQTVVMGRKTFESLPNQKPLPQRTNIILTRDNNYHIQDNNVLVYHSLDEVLHYQTNNHSEIFIIGGEQIYKLFLPFCNTAYLTKIYHQFPADKYIPQFIYAGNWILMEQSVLHQTKSGFKYQFLVYKKESNNHIKTIRTDISEL